MGECLLINPHSSLKTLNLPDHLKLALLVGSILVTLNISRGFGKHVYVVPIQNLSIIAFNGNIAGTLSIFSVTWSKTSFQITLLRITEGRTRWFIWFTIFSINILMGISALFLWIQCNPIRKTWNPMEPGTCWNPAVSIDYGIFSGIYSGVMDITLALLSWKLIWGLSILRKEKFGVALAMSMGIL
jgi:hypothetical protein